MGTPQGDDKFNPPQTGTLCPCIGEKNMGNFIVVSSAYLITGIRWLIKGCISHGTNQGLWVWSNWTEKLLPFTDDVFSQIQKILAWFTDDRSCPIETLVIKGNTIETATRYYITSLPCVEYQRECVKPFVNTGLSRINYIGNWISVWLRISLPSHDGYADQNLSMLQTLRKMLLNMNPGKRKPFQTKNRRKGKRMQIALSTTVLKKW